MNTKTERLFKEVAELKSRFKKQDERVTELKTKHEQNIDDYLKKIETLSQKNNAPRSSLIQDRHEQEKSSTALPDSGCIYKEETTKTNQYGPWPALFIFTFLKKTTDLYEFTIKKLFRA
ncbi:MAG TPA: hypothetical protein VL201_02515 [Patescibacteria group bacterium]|jgi:chromosome segregation ATPase|nr:hypothetical protein [Patescibacteria group bacterium]